ncbi:MAG: LamG domain-containing protein, partial [Planctomycetota bacterium]
SDFTSDNPSLELDKMQTLYIGFGTRFSGTPGGVGDMYFDNIRLYQPICVLSERSAAFAKLDLDDDCIIGFGDVEVMGAEWLESDVNLGEVTNPSDTNLVGWWKLDDGDGNVATDSSSYNHHGTVETNGVNVEWVAGRPNDVNYALEFSGGRVLVPDSQELRPLHQVSAAAWIKYAKQTQSSARVLVKGKNDKEAYAIEVGADNDLVFLVRDGNDPNLAEYPDYDADSDKNVVERDEWVHVAGTYDGNSIKAYVNGEVVAESNDANSNVIPFLSQDTNDLAIGNKAAATDDPFKGIIDDVRVYDRGLTAAEIGYLASDGTGIFVEKSIANLIDGEAPGERAVNLRDFAILADEWLTREFWP